ISVFINNTVYGGLNWDKKIGAEADHSAYRENAFHPLCLRKQGSGSRGHRKPKGIPAMVFQILNIGFSYLKVIKPLIMIVT
ncbi:MAG TPA: hypothetical protein VLP30_01290, partial [Desulfatirhabdiaceae bacterium]|nr:hypothetical protein [Desulfatirhabdiaceae bacterium]